MTKQWEMFSEPVLIPYRLQFFADEGADKTEEATPKKLQDARKEGQVAKSQEISTAFMLLALFVMLKVFVGFIGKRFLKIFAEIYPLFSVYAREDFTKNIATAFLRKGLAEVLITGLPLLVIAVAVAFAVNVVQVKWQVTTKPLKPKFDKFNPAKGIKRIFSKDKLFELVKDIVKLSLIFYIAYSELKKKADAVVLLYDFSLNQAVAYIGDFIINLGIKLSAFYLIIGVAD